MENQTFLDAAHAAQQAAWELRTDSGEYIRRLCARNKAGAPIPTGLLSTAPSETGQLTFWTIFA